MDGTDIGIGIFSRAYKLYKNPDAYSKIVINSFKNLTTQYPKFEAIHVDKFLLRPLVKKTIEDYFEYPDQDKSLTVLKKEFFVEFDDNYFSEAEAETILLSLFRIINDNIKKDPELREYFNIYLLRKIYINTMNLSEDYGSSKKIENNSEDTRILSNLLVHELVAPVAAIKGEAELMLELLKNSNERDLIETCQSIWDTAERYRVLLANLSFIYLENVERNYIFNSYDICEIIRDCLKPYIFIANLYNLKILWTKTLNLSEIYVTISKENFELALKNVFHNAIKYSYKDIDNQYNDIKIKIFIPKDNRFWKVIVSNYGVEIEPNEIKNREITHKYYRGKIASDMERTGVGLGLYVADKIIERHKGKLKFCSKKVCSSKLVYLNTFVITCPFERF
jgi:signal transduction histidine kinase